MSVFMNMDKLEETLFETPNIQYNNFLVKDATTYTHWHNHLEFVRCISKTCKVEISGIQYLLQKHDVIFIPPNHLHGIICTDGIYMAYVFGDHLLGKIKSDQDIGEVVSLFEHVSFNESMIFRENRKLTRELHRLLDFISDALSEQFEGYHMSIKLQLCQILFLLYRKASIEFDDVVEVASSVQYVKNGLEYIEAHYQTSFNMSDICDVLHISQQHFARLFKRHTGMTFMSYLNVYRLDKVKWLLRNTAIPITQIPEQVGLCNANYMAKVFKKHVGKSPRMYRQM